MKRNTSGIITTGTTRRWGWLSFSFCYRGCLSFWFDLLFCVSLSQVEVLNKYLFLTSKPMIYLVNLSEKDYVRKKNKWWVLERSPLSSPCWFTLCTVTEESTCARLRPRFLGYENCLRFPADRSGRVFARESARVRFGTNSSLTQHANPDPPPAACIPSGTHSHVVFHFSWNASFACDIKPSEGKQTLAHSKPSIINSLLKRLIQSWGKYF